MKCTTTSACNLHNLNCTYPRCDWGREIVALNKTAVPDKPENSFTRYWYHPESECLFLTLTKEEPEFLDGNCEELTKEEYDQRVDGETLK